ncbi:hypothetical protein RvY_02516 [Ramazzottius varieornatus]|uniref:Uncharacterized protein n=1 Tax=Ramazzottius varieornatus TaxID=947166 RepID=A0A1D1UV41_RAMVA|nr:hypothetical protein RvY_02516 [Ramazzottius varieornatus]
MYAQRPITEMLGRSTAIRFKDCKTASSTVDSTRSVMRKRWPCATAEDFLMCLVPVSYHFLVLSRSCFIVYSDRMRCTWWQNDSAGKGRLSAGGGGCSLGTFPEVACGRGMVRRSRPLARECRLLVG